MSAVDPTYPLYPVAATLASVGVLLVLLTSFIRKNWNLGVAFLCFWLFLEIVSEVANTIIWSENADIKHYVYCDIVSRLHIVTFVVEPMATLIIIRRLYLIASLQSVELPNKASRIRNLCIEWTLGLVIPLLIAGPIYYVDQGARFQVDEGFGCTNAWEGSILTILIQQSWSVIPPVASIVFYYPRVIRIFYMQNKDINRFLQTNTSVSRTNYLRILLLASIDILLTLPIGIVNIVLSVLSGRAQGPYFVFYAGWDTVHSDWEPVSISYAYLKSFNNASPLVLSYFSIWTSPVLAFVIFGLFGLTQEARASYWRLLCAVGAWFGWEPKQSAQTTHRSSLGTIDFAMRPQELSLDAETGSQPSFIESHSLRPESRADKAEAKLVGPSKRPVVHHTPKE